MACNTIAVVGAGFSGTLLAMHLLRRTPPSTCVVLIERRAEFGRGTAYATGNPMHLLNVPAGRMSAFHDQPLDFLHWLYRNPDLHLPGGPPTVDTFVSREIYGQYVRDMLNAELHRPGSENRLEVIRADVVAAENDTDRMVLRLDDGTRIGTDFAVLAVGNFPPEPMPLADTEFYDSPFYRADPWADDVLDGLDPTAPVLLVGTGLTTVDTVISLLDLRHTGPILALSRRGLVPRRHADPPAPPLTLPNLPATLNELTRLIHRLAQEETASGRDWRAAIDALRPSTQRIWRAMPHTERTRFLRHLRPWWDVHRHRMAGAVADRIDAARASGQLTVRAGRIRRFQSHQDRVEVWFRPRGSEPLQTVTVARVVNCLGPGADYDRIAHPLVRSLLKDGLARPDALRLGLDVADSCAVLGLDGMPSPRLFAVGPVTRSRFWEITAVPDIRRQCEEVAGHLAALGDQRTGASATLAW